MPEYLGRRFNGGGPVYGRRGAAINPASDETDVGPLGGAVFRFKLFGGYDRTMSGVELAAGFRTSSVTEIYLQSSFFFAHRVQGFFGRSGASH